MSNSFFQFKKFRIEQGGAAMKVGTDGVLLGAWCRVGAGQRRWLDVGTGTGLITLMVAQRLSALEKAEDFRIDALEIDAGAARQAAANVAASPWPGNIYVLYTDFQSFAADPENHNKYDHIVSNPPYYVGSLRSPDAGRDRARHADTLPYVALAGGVMQLLAPGGILSVVLPAAESVQFVTQAVAAGFHLRRRTEVATRPGTPPKRVLLEFSFAIGPQETAALLLSDGSGGGFSEGYRTLTQDFYLDF